jgi:hypothetical protein
MPWIPYPNRKRKRPHIWDDMSHIVGTTIVDIIHLLANATHPPHKL